MISYFYIWYHSPYHTYDIIYDIDYDMNYDIIVNIVETLPGSGSGGRAQKMSRLFVRVKKSGIFVSWIAFELMSKRLLQTTGNTREWLSGQF